MEYSKLLLTIPELPLGLIKVDVDREFSEDLFNTRVKELWDIRRLDDENGVPSHYYTGNFYIKSQINGSIKALWSDQSGNRYAMLWLSLDDTHLVYLLDKIAITELRIIGWAASQQECDVIEMAFRLGYQC